LIKETLQYWKLLHKKQEQDLKDIEQFADRLDKPKARVVWKQIKKRNDIIAKMIEVLE
jgi:hypothetical protein